MFKKLKDKIAEEVKQSPLKFQTSVQHFTQSVSPSLSFASNLSTDTNPTLESRGDEAEDIHDLECDNSFTTVDLRSPVTPKNRSSSTSSNNCDLFPVYEFPRQLSLQSDLESCSEFDDGSSIHQFNNVTKENLYEKYRTALQKYHKYRGRFSDLQKFCKELQRELNKAKNVLTETQDKAIRRIVELKEQSSLEQKAKAHLEDALRNELEERGHLINTLNMKIELLKSGKNDTEDEKPINALQQSLNLQNIEVTASQSETNILKEKIQELEALLDHAKETIANQTSQINDLQVIIETDKNNLKSAQDQIVNLEENINLMRRKEEEALLSLAENKLHVHQELDAKESQIKTLLQKIVDLNEEIKKVGTTKSNTENVLESCSNSKNEDYEALKHELQLLTSSRNTDQNTIAEKDRLIREFKTAIDASNQELSRLKNELEASTIFSRIDDSDPKNDLKQTQVLESPWSEKRQEFESIVQRLTATKEQLEVKVQQLEQELSVVKTERLEKSTLCESLEEKFAMLASKFKKSETDLAEKETLMNEKLNEVRQLASELEHAKAKIKEYTNDKKVWLEAEMHLKADKIVLEEKVKSIQKELNNAQTEVKNLRSTVFDLEKNLQESKKLEKRLTDKENELAQLKIELEHDMLVKTANLLEEINSFKTKENDRLREIRALKEDLHNLQAQLKTTEESKIKLDKLNESINVEMKQLNAEIDDKRKIESELTTLRDDLCNCRKEKDELRTEVSQCSLELEQLRDVNLKFDSLQQELQSVNVTRDNLLREKTELEIEIERLRTEYDFVVKELKDTRDRETVNQELTRDLQSSQQKWSNAARIVEDEVNTLKNENEQLAQQNETLKRELTEEKSKMELPSTKGSYQKLEEEFSEIQKYVLDFLAELQPILKNCIHLNNRLRQEEKRNQNLIGEITLNANTVEQLEAQLALSNRNHPKNGALCNRDTLSRLRICIASLKNEHGRMRNEILDKLNTLKLYSQECSLKMKNGPVKIAQDNMNYISELETRLSDVEPVCARLKCKVLEYENENRKLLDRVDELSSNLSDIAPGSQLEKLEQEYADKIRKIVTDYEVQLLRKDEIHKELENSSLVQNRNEMTIASHETDSLQKVEEELAAKQMVPASNTAIFNDEIVAIREQHAKELREIDKRWRSCLDKKIQEIETKYKEEINELTKEWSTDRKRSISTDKNILQPAEIQEDKQALEKYASRNEDAAALKKQVELLSNELCNYRRSHWKNIELDSYSNSDNAELSLEDCTELEYLRNILFEYMMGHQPLVLAKVLAAVVKFDSNQTRQVLEKEEQKLTLLGHLGLS